MRLLRLWDIIACNVFKVRLEGTPAEAARDYMNKREQYKHLLNYCANLITLAIEAGCFAVVWFTYYSEAMEVGFHQKGHWAMIGLYLLLAFFFTKVFGGYKIGYLRITDGCLAHILAILLAAVVEYFLIVLACREYVSTIPLALMALTEIALIIPWTMIVRRIYKRLYPPRQTLVIYGEYPPDDLIGKMNMRKDRYNVCASASCYIGYEKLYTMIKKYEAVILCDLPAEIRNQIMKYCYQESVRVYVTPKISDILMSAADDIHLFDTPLLVMRNQGLTIDERFFKRIEDIVFSLLGIIITSPIMLIIAVCIKLHDGGPVFYKQERYTRDGKIFDILKFRSMTVHKEEPGAAVITQKGDKRVTPVGRFIRRTHLDELPQLFNILKGEMALVGPRAEWVETTDKYIEVVPEFIFRLKVKAGLTGYAQVYGKYSTTPYDKVKLEITYIENYSIWLDMKLILLTVKILFDREKTEGVEKKQTNAIRTGGTGTGEMDGE